MPGMIQSGAMPFAVFANCPSSELSASIHVHSCIERYLFWQFRAPRAGWKPHPDDMVPKQCPFRRPTVWYQVYCATCLGSRDNSKYHTYIHDPSRISIDCLTPASRLRRSASVWIIHLCTSWNSWMRSKRKMTTILHSNQLLSEG